MAEDSIHLLLGRLDGKMDMLLANQSAQNTRLDKHEARIQEVEQKVDGINSGVSTSKAWLTYLFSGTAMLVSLGTFIKSFFMGVK